VNFNAYAFASSQTQMALSPNAGSCVNPVRGLTTFWTVLYSSRSRFIR